MDAANTTNEESPATKFCKQQSPIKSETKRMLDAVESVLNKDEKKFFDKAIKTNFTIGDAQNRVWLTLKEQEIKKEERKSGIRNLCLLISSNEPARRSLFKLPCRTEKVSNQTKNKKSLPLNLLCKWCD